jgi:hypothetical protein
MRRLIACAVAAGALASAAPAASAATDCYAEGAPVCVRAAVTGPASIAGSFKPKRITTIEYTVPIVQITWTSWTATKAVGRGRLQRCGACDPADPGARVTVTLLKPIEYFCGPDDESVEPIGTWFSRATVKGSVMNVSRKIYGDGHPNAC